MGQMLKVDANETVSIIEQLNKGELSSIEAGTIIGRNHTTVFKWKRLYREKGRTALLEKIEKIQRKEFLKSNPPTELPDNVQGVVNVFMEYFHGDMGLYEAARRIGCSAVTLGRWKKIYIEKGASFFAEHVQKGIPRLVGTAPVKRVNLNDSEVVSIIARYSNGEINQATAARLAGVLPQTIRRWLSAYQAGGETALLDLRHRVGKRPKYTESIKLEAVKEYLAGGKTLTEICEQYDIKSKYLLSSWIKAYNVHEESCFSGYTGGSLYMGKSRNTTLEERIAIAKACLEAGKTNYAGIALQFHVSIDQVRSWVRRYETLGEAGLEDRRGIRAKDQVPRTELEAAQKEIAELKHKLYLAEVERDLLKKLDEVERREDYRK